MEAMKIDLTSKKGKYTVDHNSIVQEIDQVQKKQRVHKAHLADIQREESLLKIQIREAKRDDVGSQILKKTGLQYWYKCFENWFKVQKKKKQFRLLTTVPSSKRLIKFERSKQFTRPALQTLKGR